MDLLYIGITKLSSRHKGWRIIPAICGPRIVNLPLVMATNRLGSYIIITNRWAGRSAFVPLLRPGLGKSLGEPMLQLKQNKLDLNNKNIIN